MCMYVYVYGMCVCVAFLCLCFAVVFVGFVILLVFAEPSERSGARPF